MLLDEITLSVGAVVSEGAFGRVHVGTYVQTPVVIKFLKDPLHERAFLSEARILGSMSHPNIVSMLASDKTRIVLEQYQADAKNIVGDDQLVTVARDCMRGLAYMHAHDGCTRHGDIKPANILLKLGRDGTLIKAALGDMGLSRDCGDTTMIGTLGYMPQIRGSSDQMHDIFALAVSLLNASFNQYVHASKEVYSSVSEYPVSGPGANAVDNTMYFADALPEWIKEPLSQMLMLVHREGDTREEKYMTTSRILDQWDSLVNIPASIEPPVASEASSSPFPGDDPASNLDETGFHPDETGFHPDETGLGEIMELGEVVDEDFVFN